MNAFWHNHKWGVTFVAIAALFVVLSLGSALRESLTYDEILHSQEGLNHLLKQMFTVDPYNPPLTRELQMLPVALGVSTERLFASRLVAVFLGVLLLLSVYVTTRKHFGAGVGLLALLLLAFEPNIVAHSHYVTPDIGTALFFFLAYIALLGFLEHASVGRVIWLGISLGMALASRVFVIPYFIASAAVAGLFGRKSSPRIAHIAAIVLIGFLVVWAAYFFRMDVVIAKREDAARISAKLKNSAMAQRYPILQYGLYVLESQPLPLGNYLATVKNSFLRGMQNTSKPAWYEMIVNVLLKTPIPLLFLTAGALWRVKREKTERARILTLLIPVVAIVGTAVVTGMEPRVRYVLGIYPFLAIIAAVGVGKIRERGIWGKTIIAMLLIWYVVGTLVQYPHFISYANELLPREKRYLYLTDSNIDWGQSLPDMAAYIQKIKPSHVSFSYFGRDNGNDYGLVSNRQWGSYTFEDICAFHEIALPYNGERLAAISVSNWHGCGYSKEPQFAKENVREVVGDSILIF